MLRFGALALLTATAAWSQMTYHAKIVLEDNIPLPTTPQVMPDMIGQFHTACRVYNVFGNGNVVYATAWDSISENKDHLDACRVTIRLSGYKPMTVTLREGATVVLKRAGDHEGLTVSAAAAAVPDAARKAYAKGVGAMSKQKWPAAQQSFESAVAIYPDYAQAWSDLGEALRAQSKAAEARAAYEKALKVDPTYMRVYLLLARLDLAEGRNEEALRLTDGALVKNPTEFPPIFFYNAVANFNLKHFDAAEKSGRKAIELDSEHELPRAEALLGTILAAKGDRQGAIEHLKKYLEISPKATDAGEVRQHIETLRQGK